MLIIIFRQKFLNTPNKIYPKPGVTPNIEPRTFTNIISRHEITGVNYSWDEILVTVREIKEKHFHYDMNCINCDIRLNNRFRKMLLGRAWRRKNLIELSTRLMNTESRYLKQVIFHELVHIEFPGEGHQGPNFRRKEKYNPYREKISNRLSCVG